jgi:hypothetical protein
MLVGSIEVEVAGVAKALMPEKAFSARVKLVKAKLLDRAGGRRIDGSKQCIDLKVGSVGKRGRFRGRGVIRREQERRGVTQAMVKSAMKLDVFRLAKFVMCYVGENAGVGKLVDGRACKVSQGNQLFNRAGGNDDGWDLGAMITENG